MNSLSHALNMYQLITMCHALWYDFNISYEKIWWFSHYLIKKSAIKAHTHHLREPGSIALEDIAS